MAGYDTEILEFGANEKVTHASITVFTECTDCPEVTEQSVTHYACFDNRTGECFYCNDEDQETIRTDSPHDILGLFWIFEHQSGLKALDLINTEPLDKRVYVS